MSQPITTKDILMLLPLSVLSFADPISDILTLMEYYSAGHKIWFAIGLIFLLLPLPAFLIGFFATGKDSGARWLYNTVCLCGFHPFTVGFQRLEAFFVCGFKKFWKGEEIVKESYGYDVLESSEYAACLEAIYESAPQFVIQLYVVSVQTEPLSIIQGISLPISFLSLVWGLKDDTPNIPIKYKILDLLANTFLLSTRLFAITYFVVGFTWWVIGILVLHFIVLRCLHYSYPYDNLGETNGCCEWVLTWYFIFPLSCLGFETFDTQGVQIETARKNLRRIIFVSYCVIVLENIIMILLYYVPFGHPFTVFYDWYSLPVTVYVCLFSVVGFVLRFAFIHSFVLNDNYVHPE